MGWVGIFVGGPIAPMVDFVAHEEHRCAGNGDGEGPAEAGFGAGVPIVAAAGELDEISLVGLAAAFAVGGVVVGAEGIANEIPGVGIAEETDHRFEAIETPAGVAASDVVH